jgi:hypothetical protein
MVSNKKFECILQHTGFLNWEVVTTPLSLQAEDHPCHLFMTAYWIYLQLLSLSGGHVFHLQPKDPLCHGEKELI